MATIMPLILAMKPAYLQAASNVLKLRPAHVYISPPLFLRQPEPNA